MRLGSPDSFAIVVGSIVVPLVLFASIPLFGAVSPEEAAVMASYKALERAVRDGNGAAWLHLMDSATLASMPGETKQNWLRGRFRDASIRYEAIGVRIQGHEAAVIGKITSLRGSAPQVHYHSLIFVRDGNDWKLATEQYNDSAIDRAALYVMVPPESSAFTRAGSPWNSVAYAVASTKRLRQEDAPWNLQATRDEDFVHLRLEARKTLPQAGSEIHKPAGSMVADTGVPSVPVLKLKVSDVKPGSAAQEYELHTGAVLQTRATPDNATGKYNNRFFVQYVLSVKKITPTGSIELFDSHTGERFSRLIGVEGAAFTIKLPLPALGADPMTQITLEEFNSSAQWRPYLVSVFKR